MVSGIQRIERVLLVSSSAPVGKALAMGVRARRRSWVTTVVASTSEAVAALDAGLADTVVVDAATGDDADARRCLMVVANRHPGVRRVALVSARTQDAVEVVAADGALPLRSDAERLCRAVETAQQPNMGDLMAAVG